MSQKQPMTLSDRLFCGVYPGGLVWADRGREKAGDYAKLAFMPYDTLEAKFEADFPKAFIPLIQEEVKRMQERRGQEFRTSATGQAVILGSR